MKRKRKTSGVIGLVIVFSSLSAERERVWHIGGQHGQLQHLSSCLSSRLLSPLALKLHGLYLLARCGAAKARARAHEKVDQVKTDLQENKPRLASAVWFKSDQSLTTKYTDEHTTKQGRSDVTISREIWLLACALSSHTDRIRTGLFFLLVLFFPIFSQYDGTFYLSLNTCRTSGIPFITLWLKSTPSNRVRADGAFTEIVDGWMGVDLQPTRCPSAFDPFKFSVWLPFPRGKGMNENVLHDTRNCYYYYN